MNIALLGEELTKYRIVFEGLSILPFALKLGVYYLPTNQRVGEITGFLGKINGWLEVQNPKVRIEFKDGKWVVGTIF